MKPATTDPVLEQAAKWYAELQDQNISEARKQDWQAWLLAHPKHCEAWTRVELIDQQFVDLPGREARHALQAAGRSRRQMLKGIAGLALASPAGWLLWQSPVWRADERTAVGEIRHLTLPDGSDLWLNTASAVKLDFRNDRRDVHLLTGEIGISTAKDSRPFTVTTPHGSLQPLGTRFKVRLDEDSTKVSVTEGRVAIRPHKHADTQTLEAGQSRSFNARQIGGLQTPSPANKTWERGVLIADNISLGEFLMELNRYRSGVIRWDAEVAQLRLVGAFPLDDTDRILAALEDTLPIKIRRITPWWITISTSAL